MVKNVLKEIFIMLLLLAAIILVLAVVFYEYNPMNKVVPNAVSYKMPDNLSDVKEELESTLITQEEQIIKTYELTERELKLSTKVNYEPGKANPFEAYTEETTDNTVTGNNTSSSKGNTTNTGSTGSFFEDGSKK